MSSCIKDDAGNIVPRPPAKPDDLDHNSDKEVAYWGRALAGNFDVAKPITPEAAEKALKPRFIRRLLGGMALR